MEDKSRNLRKVEATVGLDSYDREDTESEDEIELFDNQSVYSAKTRGRLKTMIQRKSKDFDVRSGNDYIVSSDEEIVVIDEDVYDDENMTLHTIVTGTEYTARKDRRRRRRRRRTYSKEEAAVVIQCFWRVRLAVRQVEHNQAVKLQKKIDIDAFGNTTKGGSKILTELDTQWEEVSVVEQAVDDFEVVSEPSEHGAYNASRPHLNSYFQRRSITSKLNIAEIQSGQRVSNLTESLFKVGRNDSEWSKTLFEGEGILSEGEEWGARREEEALSESSSDEEYLVDDQLQHVNQDSVRKKVVSFGAFSSIMNGTVITGSCQGTLVNDMDLFSNDEASSKPSIMKSLTRVFKVRSKKSSRKRVEFAKDVKSLKNVASPKNRLKGIIKARISESGMRRGQRQKPGEVVPIEEPPSGKPLSPWHKKLREVNRLARREKSDGSTWQDESIPKGIAARMAERFGGSTLKRRRSKNN